MNAYSRQSPVSQDQFVSKTFDPMTDSPIDLFPLTSFFDRKKHPGRAAPDGCRLCNGDGVSNSFLTARDEGGTSLDREQPIETH
jgi:hypothetical protein